MSEQDHRADAGGQERLGAEPATGASNGSKPSDRADLSEVREPGAGRRTRGALCGGCGHPADVFDDFELPDHPDAGFGYRCGDGRHDVRDHRRRHRPVRRRLGGAGLVWGHYGARREGYGGSSCGSALLSSACLSA